MGHLPLEPITKFIKAAKAGYVAASLVFGVLGVVLLTVPEASPDILCSALGAVMVFFGVVKIIGYLSRDLYRLAFQYDLAFGILMLTLGVIMLFHIKGIDLLFHTVFGILLLADGLFRIQLSVDARAFGLQRWQMILGLAVAAGILGTLLVLHPVGDEALVRKLLGIAFLFEGALSLCVALCAVKVDKKKTDL